ncbi:MAG: MFS transporter, partial [Polyangia bacterium]
MACFAPSAASYVPFIGVALWILPRRAAATAAEAPAYDARQPFAGNREVARTPPRRWALATV